MSSIDTHGLSVGQATNIIPIYFLISKTGPSVSSTLDQELFHGSTLGSSEQQLSGIGIVEVNWPGCVFGFLVECSLFKVSRVFSVMSIMIADLICLLSVASPPKIGLNRTTYVRRQKRGNNELCEHIHKYARRRRSNTQHNHTTL